VNAQALRAEAADPHAPTGFRYRAAKLGRLLGADRLDGTMVELDPGERSEPYHYVYGREEVVGGPGRNTHLAPPAR
jgi:uncharacterized cupin superfamily protein